MEPVTFAIGGAIAKWAFRMWAGDSPNTDLSTDVADIIAQRVTDPYQRRSVKRQFETLADEITKRIDPYLSHEIQGVEDHEREAACRAVQETVDRAFVDTSSILQLDLDPIRIKQHMLEIDPTAKERNLLSDGGASIYDALLSELCSYIAASASSLPGFQTHQTAELLSRETQIIDMLRLVLDKIPQSALPNSWGSGADDVRFENEYRKTIFRYADKLQLFGVNSTSAKSIYSLSVAYISMAVSTISENSDLEKVSADASASTWSKEIAENVTAEAAIGAHSRVLISGQAGSGKTTLLQWIATNAAANSFSGELDSWNNRIPFLIPLRRFVQRSLPAPEEFLQPTTPAIAGAMPAGWVHKVLGERRGIVLIDGLDELPLEQRQETKSWLDDLIATFPDNKFIVTSRTTALEGVWSDVNTFHHAQLLPMEYSDIKYFVAHWHNAAIASAVSSDAIGAIREAEKMLLARIRDKSGIRSLCTSPLLCALVCALNLDRAGSLPENRMDLYDTALQMLVIHRDEARHVPVAEEVDLDYREAEVLLRSFALWLHENGQADASKEDFIENVGRQLRTLHRISAAKENVAQHLLIRSGVLREPVPGRVDFIHRTFLEYLAARAIIDDNSIEKLILHAHEDHWREVVIMAAGHASSNARERLLNGLISKGRNDSGLRHRLFLLAVACMETSTELSPELQGDLQSCLEQVMPPHNITDAIAVASAGSIAIPLLASFRGYATVTAACIRALALIGGESALSAVANFADDKRLTVSRELIRAWSSFDSEAYASKVLAKSVLDRGGVRVRDPDHLHFLPLLENLRHVQADIGGRGVELGKFPPSNASFQFELSHSKSFTDLLSFAHYPQTRAIKIQNCSTLTSLSGLELLHSLHVLDLEGCSNLRGFGSLSEAKQLRWLDVSRTPIASLDVVEGLENLDVLYARQCPNLSNLGERVSARRLFIGFCPKLVTTDALGRSENVKSLHIHYQADGLSAELPPNVHDVTLHSPNLHNFTGGMKMKELTVYGRSNSANLLSFVMERQQLSTLAVNIFDLDGDMTAVGMLSDHPSLREITFYISDSRKHGLPSIPGFERVDAGPFVEFVKAE